MAGLKTGQGLLLTSNRKTMNRNEAISTIKSLYPPDSDFPETQRIGRELLRKAKDEVEGWEKESDDVLIRFAQLSIERELRS